MSRILLPAIQALAHAEEPSEVLGGDADAVVADMEAPGVAQACRANPDLRAPLRTELDAVANEILEEQDQFGFDAQHVNGFKPFRDNFRAALFQRRLEQLQRCGHY